MYTHIYIYICICFTYHHALGFIGSESIVLWGVQEFICLIASQFWFSRSQHRSLLVAGSLELVRTCRAVLVKDWSRFLITPISCRAQQLPSTPCSLNSAASSFYAQPAFLGCTIIPQTFETGSSLRSFEVRLVPAFEPEVE